MSAQALVRVGSPLDLYYTDADNAKKQAINVEYDTRYVQDLANKSQGVSVLVIPPNMGVRHVLIVLGYNASSMTSLAGASNGYYALPKGWGYNALSQISFRIGGSSQYFLTGAQLLARNLRLVRTKEQRNSLLNLGGSQCTSVADFSQTQYAYIPVSVWSAPGEDELQIPLPTDLLSQQVQVTAQLNAPSAIFAGPPVGWAGGAAPTLPTAFDTAYFQIEQLVMRDRGMALANRVNMADHMYSMPLPTFDQQEIQLQIGASSSTAVEQTVLTGFRSGEVKKLQIWLTQNVSSATPGLVSANANVWYKPASIQALYAGQVYANYQSGSSAIWNLLDGTAPSAVDSTTLSSAGGLFVSTSSLSEWVEMPFAQPSGSDYSADILVHGKEITNGIINLQIAPPSANALGWTVHVVYVYNCTVGFSKGSADLIF